MLHRSSGLCTLLLVNKILPVVVCDRCVGWRSATPRGPRTATGVKERAFVEERAFVVTCAS